MKKQLGTFIVGIITGVIGVLLVVHFNDDKQGPGNLNTKPVMYNAPREGFISKNNFKVYQALSKGYGLAVELEKGTYSNNESASGVKVLFYDAEGKEFETGEVIKLPAEKCVREVGIYSYTNEKGDTITVPVGQIMDDNENAKNKRVKLEAKPVMFETPGEIIKSNKFKVSKPLEKGYAFASELEEGSWTNQATATGKIVMFYDPSGKEFERLEEITVPEGKCLRKVGTYTFTKENGAELTVPVVQILDK